MGIKCMSRLVSCLCCLAVALMMFGCGGKSPSVTYYSLSSFEPGDLGSESLVAVDVGLGIGPVSVPEYLKRSQIATRLGSTNRFQFDEFNRWAGIVEKDIASVLGENLGMLLGTHKIAFFPWMPYFKPDYQIVVEIIQFDSDLNSDATLSARWSVNDASGKNILSSGKNDYQQTLASPTYDALVVAENQLLEDFSRDIAKEVRMLNQSK